MYFFHEKRIPYIMIYVLQHLSGGKSIKTNSRWLLGRYTDTLQQHSLARIQGSPERIIFRS